MTQWYEEHPDLLEKEKGFMNKHFLQFELEKLDDGRLCWIGEINSPFNSDVSYILLVLYHSNYPSWVMGSSISVYMIEPDDSDYMKYGPRYILGLKCQVAMDNYGICYMAIWKEQYYETQEPAVTVLRRYIAWLYVTECYLQYGTRTFDYTKLIQLYPSLETTIKNLIYGKI